VANRQEGEEGEEQLDGKPDRRMRKHKEEEGEGMERRMLKKKPGRE
jgi:hypothetical protein